MKVLVFNDSARPRGGTEVYVRTYIRLLLDAGHDVALITGDADDPRGPELAGARWFSIPEAFAESLQPANLARNWSAAMPRVRALVAREIPDLVNLHLVSAWQTLLALLGQVPVMRFVHTAWWYCPAGTRWLPASGRVCTEMPGLRCLTVDREEKCLCTPDGAPFSAKNKARRLVDIQVQAHFLRRASLAVANSRFTAAELARTQGHEENVRVLYPPVDPVWTAPLGPPPEGARSLLGIGRLERVKGFDHAILALRSLPEDFHLVLAGEGSQEDALRRVAAREGLSARVRFAGWLDSAQLREEMARASAVVFPSLWPEPFGQVGVQAMLAGRGVIAYDAGGVPEWIGAPEGGRLATPNDPRALAQAIADALPDRAAAVALGESASKRAARLFAPGQYAARLEQLMHEAHDRFHRAAAPALEGA